MTADLTWLTREPGRCRRCYFHIEAQGHTYPCEPSGPLGLMLARQAAAVGMERTTAAHAEAVFVIDAAILRRVKRGEVFSANTIRDELGELSPEERPAIGARINSAFMRKVIRKVGEEPSTDVGTHGKKIGQWVAA